MNICCMHSSGNEIRKKATACDIVWLLIALPCNHFIQSSSSSGSEYNAAQIYINENTYQSEGYALFLKGKIRIYIFKDGILFSIFFFITFYVGVHSLVFSRFSNWNHPSVFHFILTLCLLNGCLQMHSERKGHPEKKDEMIKKSRKTKSNWRCLHHDWISHERFLSCVSFENEREREKDRPSFIIEDKVTGRQLSWMLQNRHKLSKLYMKINRRNLAKWVGCSMCWP